MREGRVRKPAEQVQTGCLIQTRSAGRSEGWPEVARTSVAAAAAAGGTIVVAVVGVATPLVVGRVGVEPVVVAVTLAVDATIHPVVGPIAPAWLLVGPAVATG